MTRNNRKFRGVDEQIYLAQCIAGLQEFVAWRITQDYPKAEIRHTEEGMVIFAGDASIAETKPIYVNNLFLVLHVLDKGNINAHVTACVKETRWLNTARQATPKTEQTFRLFISDENQLVSVDREKLGRLIKQIETNCGLRHHAQRPDTEFWLFRRRGGMAFLCKRLTNNRLTEKDLKPGELRPELAASLCLMSEPAADDIFLDPFAGSGALAFARKKWPYEMMFVSDIAADKVKAIKTTISSKKNPIITRVADATNLDKFEDGFIGKIVTDPPWGLFDNSIADIPGFYKSLLKELARVTKKDGLIVMLTGQRDIIKNLTRDFDAELSLEARFDILVSGKKASIVRWKRK